MLYIRTHSENALHGSIILKIIAIESRVQILRCHMLDHPPPVPPLITREMVRISLLLPGMQKFLHRHAQQCTNAVLWVTYTGMQLIPQTSASLLPLHTTQHNAVSAKSAGSNL